MIKQKFAFTLAEVLITLMIIGVIASLTIPSLQEDANQRAYAASCKKAFSTLSNALALAEQMNGPARKWGLKDSTSYEDFKEYILPHLSVMKVCNGNKGCFGDGKYFAANKSSYADLSENGYGTPAVSFMLADGMSVSYDYNPDSSVNKSMFGVITTAPIILFVVDVNGSKAPNTLGQDVFFFVNTKGGLKPAGADVNLNQIDCGKGKKGTECASLVLKYGDLNYDKHIEEAKSSGAGGSSGGKQEPTDKRKGS